jgi:hypothetical protein
MTVSQEGKHVPVVTSFYTMLAMKLLQNVPINRTMSICMPVCKYLRATECISFNLTLEFFTNTGTFSPENGDTIFLQNVGIHIQVHIISQCRPP